MNTPYWQGENVTLYHGDCIEVMAGMAENSINAIVCDPPYSLGFMGRAWDTHDTPAGFQEWCKRWAVEALRVLKPGGHLLAFGGTRTWHRLAVAVEDAGFEIRDSIAWLYGSGFPKSLDVSKAIDKAAGADRPILDRWAGKGNVLQRSTQAEAESVNITAPATDAAREWAGWGTALKPAFEPIVFARKPLVGTVAANVQAHGTGALNIDGCRISTTDNLNGGGYSGDAREATGASSYAVKRGGLGEFVQPAGRWPANVVLDADQAAALDKQSGVMPGGAFPGRQGSQPGSANGTMGGGWSGDIGPARKMDEGGASRFFYVAKAPTAERPKQGGIAHPTVKPIDLMQWLIRLVTPPRGTVLDPFAGSGTTGEATIREGFESILIEREADYLPLIRQRFKRPIDYVMDFGDPA